MKTVMTSLLHQYLFYHLLMVRLPLRLGFRVSHVDIVAKIRQYVVYQKYID